MKIKVIKCSKSSFWYADKIGQVFDVEKCDPKGFEYVTIYDSVRSYFNKDDVMEITPHKHADLIKAWADGAVIQVMCHGIWVDVGGTIVWYPNSEYRIKPADPIPVYPKMYSTNETEFANFVLEKFVSSGDLAKYVNKYGVDGLKGQ